MTSNLDRILDLSASVASTRRKRAHALPQPAGTSSTGQLLRRLPPLNFFCDKSEQTDLQLSFLEGWRKNIAPRRSPRSSERLPSASPAERITVWTAPVRRLAGSRAYHNFLGPEDLPAIGQMRCSANRDCTLAGRVLLRVALSQTTGNRIEPRDWRIYSSPNGKPVVAAGWPSLHFSIAHTDQIAVVAVSETLPIGVDVETIDEGPSRDLIATCCYPSERLLFDATAPCQLAHEFARLWTLKEAYAKMIGVGHELDFASFGFSLEPVRVLPDAPYRERYDPHFETMWISHGRALSHLSLAIGFSEVSERNVDLVIMTLKADDDTQDTLTVPGLNIE
jgi:phosphopantetheinyl transferase